MKLAKTSNLNSKAIRDPDKVWSYLTNLDTDLQNIFLLSQGRIRLGSGFDGARGENISGEFQVFAAGAAGTTSVVTHTLNAVPIGFLLVKKSGFGDIYMTTANTSIVAFATLGTDTTSYTVFLLK